MVESPLIPQPAGFVDGRWIAADSAETIAVHNPADGEHLADVPRMGRAETDRGIVAAKRAMSKAHSGEARRNWLNAICRHILDHKADLAKIITLEQGKPLKEAAAEVEYAASFFRFFATQIERLESHVVPGRIRDCRWEVHLRPAGVVACITPWNFPLAMMAKKVAPALAAGCGVVAKPASDTPLSAVALARITELAELPAGMFNLVTGRAEPIADALSGHSAVRIISFTGSTEIGRRLAAIAAPHIKRLAMELGGNAPFIVFDDADVEAASRALVANKFRASGQTCVCANRVYVQRNVADEFTAAVVERVRQLRVGNGLDSETDIGPLINRQGFDKVVQHVQDAICRGARRIVGDDPPLPERDWGCYYPPTVLVDVQPGMLVYREETFGPVVAISQFDHENQVLESANGTEYGLAAYVFTRDEQRVERVAAALEFGHVGINTGMSPTPEVPFGGVKQSGYGREGGLEGLLEFCEPHSIVRGS
jgi:succinate-semialdehyde dehydrogenase/glutarate-semialdehyde dehydrogenase